MTNATTLFLMIVGTLCLQTTEAFAVGPAHDSQGSRGTGNIVGFSPYRLSGEDWAWLMTDTGELWRWRNDFGWMLKGTWPNYDNPDENDGVVGTGNVVEISAYTWDGDVWVWLITDTGELWRWRDDLDWALKGILPIGTSAIEDDRTIGTGSIVEMSAYKEDAREYVWIMTDTGELWRWRDDLDWQLRGTWPGEAGAQSSNWSQLKSSFGK